MPNDKKDVMVGASHYLSTQIETANIQLSIASQLSANIEQKRFVEILKRIDKEEAVAFLSVYAFLSDELIEKYEDKWSWGGLSRNEVLAWSLELIERFEDKWGWQLLSINKALPWSLELIERFKYKWNWRCLNSKAVACLPKLSLQDIEENMSYHVKKTSGA